MFSRYNHQQREVQQIWAGCTNVGGKLSSDIALGAKLRMKLFFPHTGEQLKKLDGITVDSGQGTPESLGKCMQQLGLTSNCFCVDSCGLHDLQSVLRYSILNFIGAGGLDGDNAVQRLHTMYSFYIENRSYWSDIIQLISVKWGYTADNLPKKLYSSIQAPLVTR